MNILITGGLGFIGSNLIEYANSTGSHSVVVLDNESLGKPSDIEGLTATHVKGDINNKALLKELISSCDAVIHLAADTTVIGSIENPQHNFDTNVTGIFNVLETMREFNKKKIVFASTGGAIIGEGELPLNEEQVAKPLSPYGASKLAGEGYLCAYAASFGMSAVACRFSNVYGPRSFHKGSVVAAYMKSILSEKPLTVYGDGTQSRDFVHVRDLCEVIFKSLTLGQSGVFQLGSGEETTINELLTMLSDTVGSDLLSKADYRPARPGEVHRTYCDITKARETLGYNASTPLKSGLADTWKWFNDNQAYFSKAA